jgi:hypothetical protein
MRGQHLDDVARELARPMGRRAALRLVGATALGLWLGGFRAPGAGAAAQAGCPEQTCVSGTEFCFDVCCPHDTLCCYAAPDPASPSGCVQNPHCCDPCDPQSARCMDDGYCGPGPVAQKCVDDCKKRVDDFLKDYVRKVCRGSGKSASMASLGEKAFSTFGCVALTESTLRPNRHAECERDPKSNTSPRARIEDTPALEAGPAAAEAVPADVAAIRRLLRSADAAQTRLAERVFAQTQQTPGTLRQPALARELRAYASSVNGLKKRVARAPVGTSQGRRARAVTVSALAEAGRGLTLAAQAVDTNSAAAARANGRRANAAFVRASRLARSSRGALRCGSTCA